MGPGHALAGRQWVASKGGGRPMGERGKSDEMKSRKTNLEPVEPDSDKPELQDPMGRRPHKPAVRLGREAQARIGEQLRTMYNTFVNQDVPKHLVDLIDRLNDKD
jgi:hypothetical protein